MDRVDPLGKADAGGTRIAPTDHRLEAFRDLLEAVDASDWRAGQLETRTLRAMGLSVCLCKPPGRGGVA
jgi:hypothetical protein